MKEKLLYSVTFHPSITAKAIECEMIVEQDSFQAICRKALHSPKRLKGSLVYLSGPMEAASDGGCGWRSIIAPQLKELGVGVLDPTNKTGGNPGMEFERRELANKAKAEHDYQKVRELYRPIVQEDLRMVDIASFIVCYLDGTPGVGTYDEIFMAAGQKKPVIVIAPNGFEVLSNWLFGRLDYRLFFPSIDDAMIYIKGIHHGTLTPDSNKWRFFDYNKIFGEK